MINNDPEDEILEDQMLNESEEIEFDDCSEVDYDLDYTVQY